MTKRYCFTNFFAVLILLTLLGCAGTETSRSTGVYIDDKAIATKVKTQLAADSMTEALQIEVETYKGVVQLSGFVDNKESKERAEEIAEAVTGVKEVKNNLDIRK
ncbi:MAG: BON domain-containing protein [Desulfuromonadaceae bacterium]|nr:BON domain-containing protein [Desulfuromonadaceae bacterium]